MKIKYKDSDKVLIAMGSSVGNASVGEVIEDTLLEIPSDPINYYERVSLGVFQRRDQNIIDKIEAENNFNIDTMTGRMGEEFTGIDAINLSPYLEAFRSYGRARNFAGMKAFRDGLVAASKATADQANIITEIVNEQGIDLNSY